MLADVLACRKTAGELSGQILIGGKPPSRSFMRRYTGYVEQFGAYLLLEYILKLLLWADMAAPPQISCLRQPALSILVCLKTIMDLKPC